MSGQMPVLKEPTPKRKGNKKLLAILFLLFISLLAVLFFNSSISKVAEIQIDGNRFATKEEIGQAAAVLVGDAFFRTSTETIEARIRTLPQVNEATVVKVFPGVIKMTVKEYPVVAFELSEEGGMTALLSNGANVDASNDTLLLVDKPVL